MDIKNNITYSETLIEKQIQYNAYNSQAKKISSIILLSVIVIGISSFVFLTQFFASGFFEEVLKYQRIKKNISIGARLSVQKTKIESILNQTIIAGGDQQYTTFNIYDYPEYGYYVVGRINPSSYLPQFIGFNDVKKIEKAAPVDVAAKQYGKYLIENYSNNTVECGISMYKDLGYDGFFIESHPCYNFTSKL